MEILIYELHTHHVRENFVVLSMTSRNSVMALIHFYYVLLNLENNLFLLVEQLRRNHTTRFVSQLYLPC